MNFSHSRRHIRSFMSLSNNFSLVYGLLVKMSTFESSKQHLRKVWIFLYNLKKNATQACELVVKAYPDYEIDERMFQRWFKSSKMVILDTRDKERPGQMKQFEDVELEALLDGDPSQAQDELAKTLGVNQPAISMRLKAIGMT